MALTIKTAPNMEFHYSSANTQLALIIERITNKSVSNYLETKIWQPLGMEAPAYWSLDRDGRVWKSFVVFRQQPLLNLEDVSQQRELEGNQIVSRAWVEQSTHTDPSNNSRHYYNNNWGINPKIQ
jgi:CubicO group peptidase (beta-lactamase class C family)